MTTTLTHTRAEAALIESFERVAPSLPGDERVRKQRRAALQRFAETGLPSRRVEAWKYTDLRAGLKEALPPVELRPVHVDEAALSAALGPLASLDCIRLVFVDGMAMPPQSEPRHEHGCHFGPLSAALGKPGYEWIAANLAGGSAPDTIGDLNTAFVTDGALMRVEAGARPPRPFHLVFVSTGASPHRVTTRNLIKVEAGADVTIVESHVCLEKAPRQAVSASHLDVGTGAGLTHVLHVAGRAADIHLGTLRATLAEAARLRAFQLTAGSGLARNETHVGFTGPDAKLDISGVFLGRGSDHIDTTFVIDHSTTGCESRELFKGVLDGRAKGVFQGKVIVRPEAQKTDGKQMAKALMLSEDAEFDSKPELEIYADDVACGHGATVAEIDPAMLFYLRSRGIPRPQARAMLIESFVAEAIEKVEHEPLRAALMQIAVEWLKS